MTPSPIAPLLQMQFAQSPSLGQRLQGLGTNLGAAAPALKAGANALMPGATPPTPAPPAPGEPGSMQAGPVAPGGQMPLPGTAGSAAAGPIAPTAPAPQPSLLDAIKGMQPQQILDVLRNASRSGVNVLPTGAPGSSAMQSAGMLPSTYGG